MQIEKLKLSGVLTKLSRAELKEITGGMFWYKYSDNNPTTHGVPGVGCYVTCDAQKSSDDVNWTPIAGGAPCETYCVC